MIEVTPHELRLLANRQLPARHGANTPGSYRGSCPVRRTDDDRPARVLRLETVRP